MVILPVAIPVTTPLELTLPNAGALLLHVPPVVVSESAVADPTHTVEEPVMGAGMEFTVYCCVAIQDVGNV